MDEKTATAVKELQRQFPRAIDEADACLRYIERALPSDILGMRATPLLMESVLRQIVSDAVAQYPDVIVRGPTLTGGRLLFSAWPRAWVPEGYKDAS